VTSEKARVKRGKNEGKAREKSEGKAREKRGESEGKAREKSEGKERERRGKSEERARERQARKEWTEARRFLAFTLVLPLVFRSSFRSFFC